MNVSFTPKAKGNLRDIRHYIAQDDERAADRVISRIRQTAAMFEMFPLLGHEGEILGTREFKVTGLPYLIIYRITLQTEVDILTVIHSSREHSKLT